MTNASAFLWRSCFHAIPWIGNTCQFRPKHRSSDCYLVDHSYVCYDCAIGILLDLCFWWVSTKVQVCSDEWISNSRVDCVCACKADFSYVATLLHPEADLLDEALIETIETAERKFQVCRTRLDSSNDALSRLSYIDIVPRIIFDTAQPSQLRQRFIHHFKAKYSASDDVRNSIFH